MCSFLKLLQLDSNWTDNLFDSFEECDNYLYHLGYSLFLPERTVSRPIQKQNVIFVLYFSGGSRIFTGERQPSERGRQDKME